MICFPAVKINIGLSVTEKRCDGYHNIESIFYPVASYNDCLEITESESFIFKKFGISIPGDDKNNLCVKAYELLKRDFDIPAVVIRLIKRIPAGAGLGGGSSDGASTLILLNKLFSLKLDEAKLSDYAAKLGSDCPFFILNRPAYVTGRGDEMEPVGLSLKGLHITIINPGFPISTGTAYENISLTNKKNNLLSVIDRPLNEWKDLIVNDFEEYAFSVHPKLSVIKQTLYTAGAEFALMTGSGSSIYAISGSTLKLPDEIKGYDCWQGKFN